MAFKKKEFDSRGEYVGQGSPIEDPYEHGDNTVEVVDDPMMHEHGKLEIEKFMAEIITVVVHDTTDKNAIMIIPVSVNGRTQNFIRGRPQRCRRCYVERLARAKETSYSQNLDPGQGEAVNTLYPHAALSYPFSVTQDDNPNGAAWLRKVLAEAA